MFFRRILNDPIPRYAWRRVLNLWKPMAAWSLLVWISVAIILVPLFSSLLGWSFFRGDQLVVGNTELINWIFTPFGFMYGVLTATLALIGGMIRYAGLFQIVTDDLKGTPVSVRGTALRIAPLVPKLFRLSFMVILAGAVILLPLMAGLGGIYWHFLGDHDINYYLSVHPPELNRAMIVGGIWVAIWFMGAGWILCRSLLILPAFLFGESDIREAVKESWGLSQYQSHRLLALMGLSIGLWVVTSLAVDAFILFSASFVIEWVATVSTSLRPIVFVTGLYAVITLAGSAIIGFIGFSLSATVLTKFYYESIGVRIGTNSQNVSRYLPARTLVIARYWLSTARIIPLVMVLITGSLVLSTVMLERIPEQHPVEIFAHRGGPSPAPENTVAAVEEAIAAGADYAEIDVQNSQDSVVVLLHDIDMMRVSGDSREIAHTDYSDLEDNILSSDEGSLSGEHIPATLDEVLQRADRRIKLMIELKYYGNDPGLAPAVIKLVGKYDMDDDVILKSMNLSALKQVKQLASDIPTGYVSALAVGELTRLPVDFLSIAHQRVNPSLIRAAKQQDMQVYVWTVNRADVMADMMELGVNGIITDNPGLAVRVRDELINMTPAERLLLRFRQVLADEFDE